MKTLVLVLGAGLIALGCQKSEPAPPPVASAAPAATIAPVASAAPDPAAVPAADTTVAVNTAAPAAPAAAAKAVPTEADYEVQAQSAITPTNAAQVLAAIDKQVGN